MAINIVPVKTTYLLRQHVEIAERETDRTPPVKETFDQQSLLLLESAMQGLHWKRTMEQYIVTPGELRTMVAGRTSTNRGELLALHHRAMKAMKIRYGLQVPLILQSDALNREVSLPTSSGKVSPASYQALHLPTFVPELPEAWEVGKTWEGQSKVLFGAGQFAVKHVAKVVLIERDRVTVQVDLRARASAMSREGFTLTLHPAGSWTAVLSASEVAPISCKGQCEIKVHGKLQLRKEDPPRECDLLTCSNSFEYQRIPVPFDGRFLYPVAWKPQ